MLEGKKTYIFAVLIGVVAAAEFIGYVSMGTATTLYGLLGAGGLGALRAGVAKKNK